MAWDVEIDAGDESARIALSADRVWNAFALADLDPEMRPFTRISIARAPGTSRSATLLVLRHPAFTVIAPGGEPEGVEHLLNTVDLPPAATTQSLAAHVDALARRYPRPTAGRPLLRMATTRAELASSPPASIEPRRLTMDDLPALTSLYAVSAEDYFAPHMLEQGIFFGFADGERLVAAGGTHVVSPSSGISVLGSIFTHPSARGRGHAGTITRAVAAATLDAGCDLVTLNVYADNTTAIRLYERLGFRTMHTYWSWDARLIDVSC